MLVLNKGYPTLLSCLEASLRPNLMLCVPCRSKTWNPPTFHVDVPDSLASQALFSESQNSLCRHIAGQSVGSLRPTASSIKSRLLNTSGLPSPWQRLESLAVCNMLRGKTVFRQDEHNVESFSSSGNLMLLPAIQQLQRLLWCC